MDDLLPDEAAPWAIPFFQCPEPFSEGAEWLVSRAAPPALDVREELEVRGLRFVSGVPSRDRMGTLIAAAGFIDRVPALALAIRKHVRGVSLLEADEAYDVTHSEPRWADWIFVSCPTAAGEVSALRVAENVVHEAMHLQLSLVEAREPLVRDEQAKIHSPWKDELRDLQGNLHGLYVFQCISAFLNRSAMASWVGAQGSAYISRRLCEIGQEVQQLEMSELREGLTPAGQAFLSRLIR